MENAPFQRSLRQLLVQPPMTAAAKLLASSPGAAGGSGPTLTYGTEDRAVMGQLLVPYGSYSERKLDIYIYFFSFRALDKCR